MPYLIGLLFVALNALGTAARADAQVQVGTFELSGCAVVNGGLLIADDDLIGSTLFLPDKALHDSNTHADAVIFKIQRKRKKSKPFTNLDRLIPVHDFEAISSDRNNTVFLLGSHAPKDNKRRTDREFLIRATLDLNERELESPIVIRNLLNRLQKSTRKANINLRLSRTEVRPDLNIEGLAYDGTNLVIGFRSPIAENGSAIMAVLDEQKLFDRQDTNTTIKFVDLGGLGIRGIEHIADDKFLILAGPKDDETTADSIIVLYSMHSGDTVELHRFSQQPPQKPEGIARLNDGRTVVVFDDTSSIVILELAGLN